MFFSCFGVQGLLVRVLAFKVLGWIGESSEIACSSVKPMLSSVLSSQLALINQK